MPKHTSAYILGAEDIGLQLPRKENAAADAAANRALDSGTFSEVRLEAIPALVSELGQQQRDIGLLVSFDGAARGNPGPSSSGVCMWWGHFRYGSFQPQGLLVQRGAFLGAGTNNSAEAHGLALALKTCLHYLYWLIEQIAQLTQHTDSTL